MHKHQQKEQKLLTFTQNVFKPATVIVEANKFYGSDPVRYSEKEKNVEADENGRPIYEQEASITAPTECILDGKGDA